MNKKPLRDDALANDYVKNLQLKSLLFSAVYSHRSKWKIHKTSSVDGITLSLKLDFSTLCKSYFSPMN